MALEFSTLRIGTDNYDLKDLRARQQVEALEGKVDKELVTNLLNPTLKGSTTINGITITANGDGTYVLDGTCTAFVDIRLSPWGTSQYNQCLALKAGQYKLVGTPDLASVIHSHVGIVPNDGTTRPTSYYDDGNGYILTHTDESVRYELKISVNVGAVLDNLVFKPMLTTNLEATYEDFVPYTGSTGKINSDLAELRRLIVGEMYPVGSIYMSVNDVNPSTIFGGTWERIKDTFLLASGDTYSNGSTGGEASHVLTTAELPKHTHSIPQLSGSASGGNHRHAYHMSTGNVPGGAAMTSYISNNPTSKYTDYSGDLSMSVTTNASITGENGSGTAHNNLPPYLAVNVWKRTA